VPPANGASLLQPLYYVWSAKPNPSPETAGSRRHNLGQARGVEAAGVKWKRYILPVTIVSRLIFLLKVLNPLNSLIPKNHTRG